MIKVDSEIFIFLNSILCKDFRDKTRQQLLNIIKIKEIPEIISIGEYKYSEESFYNFMELIVRQNEMPKLLSWLFVVGLFINFIPCITIRGVSNFAENNLGVILTEIDKAVVQTIINGVHVIAVFYNIIAVFMCIVLFITYLGINFIKVTETMKDEIASIVNTQD